MRAVLAGAFACIAMAAPAAEKVRLPAHPGEPVEGGAAELTGLLWTPRGIGPHPAIVMMHGCGGLFGRDGAPTSRHREWAEHFAARGFVVLHVDSFTPRGRREICGERGRTIRVGVERARDAYAALRFLQARSAVRADDVALLGWSNGGSAVLWTIAEDSAARPGDLAHDFVAAVALYPGCRRLAERRRGFRPVAPLLVLIGDGDDWTPAEPCRRLARRAGDGVDLVVYPGAVHGFDSPDMALHVRRGVATASGTATLGTDPAARADALARVPRFIDAVRASR